MFKQPFRAPVARGKIVGSKVAEFLFGRVDLAGNLVAPCLEFFTVGRDRIPELIVLRKRLAFEVARRARREGVKAPILMLTAKSELDDKVTGLDSGADDYLTKPFMTKELLARLRALCRRNINSKDGSLTFGDLSLDTSTATLTCTANGQSVRLAEKEMRIMEYMIANQGQIMTREMLALKIWGYESEAEYNNVEVYMSFTRKKLSFIGSSAVIKAVRGIGYELRCENV